MSGLRSRAKLILPRSWWDELRRVKHRSPDLASPAAMAHLRRMRAHGFDPRVVVDVGAAHGDWTASCRRIFPDAHFVMIEPLPDYERELVALEEPGRIDYVRAAAGRSDSTLPLLVPHDPGGSSFLPSSREGDTYFQRTVEVPVRPLDTMDIPIGTSLLKLDVQGYELEVLAGAGGVLDEVEVIIAECSLHRFQRDLPLVDEVIKHVGDLGYRFYDVADETRWASGTLAQVDLVFVASRSPLLGPRWWS